MTPSDARPLRQQRRSHPRAGFFIKPAVQKSVKFPILHNRSNRTAFAQNSAFVPTHRDILVRPTGRPPPTPPPAVALSFRPARCPFGLRCVSKLVVWHVRFEILTNTLFSYVFSCFATLNATVQPAFSRCLDIDLRRHRAQSRSPFRNFFPRDLT